MSRSFEDLRPVYVVGIGLHRYQRSSDATYADLGTTAVRAALDDAGLAWDVIESAATGTVNGGMAAGLAILGHLGATGLSVAQVENASASGSTAFRYACLEVAAGQAEVALALGVDKPEVPRVSALRSAPAAPDGERVLPVAHFAALADDYCGRYGVDPDVLAEVAVKNHANGAKNPFAQRQKVRTIDEVLGEAPLAGTLTRLQCCPIGEGGAAVIVASREAIERSGIDESRAVRVLSSVSRSQRDYGPGRNWDFELTTETAHAAFAQAGIVPGDVDVLELHDAFTIEELLYLEAMGFCGPGEASKLLVEGAWSIGGRCAVSPSGGLLAMGHPLGPTGVGQIVEITRQLRGEAGDRQQPGAGIAVAHMVGVGAVCLMHVLARE